MSLVMPVITDLVVCPCAVLNTTVPSQCLHGASSIGSYIILIFSYLYVSLFTVVFFLFFHCSILGEEFLQTPAYCLPVFCFVVLANSIILLVNVTNAIILS